MTTETEEIVIPEHFDFDSLKKIIQGYLEAGADKNPVTYKQVASITGLSDATISLNNKFFVYINLLSQEGRGRYKLTSLGVSCAQSLLRAQSEVAQELLWTAIKNRPLFQKIISFIKINGAVNKSDLVSHIQSSIVRAPPEPRYLIGINAVIDMLLFTKRITKKEEIITLTELVKKEVELPPEEVELVWFVINGEHYGIRRELIVEFIKNQGQKAHTGPLII